MMNNHVIYSITLEKKNAIKDWGKETQSAEVIGISAQAISSRRI
jgi:hypothetical protein